MAFIKFASAEYCQKRAMFRVVETFKNIHKSHILTLWIQCMLLVTANKKPDSQEEVACQKKS